MSFVGPRLSTRTNMGRVGSLVQFGADPCSLFCPLSGAIPASFSGPPSPARTFLSERCLGLLSVTHRHLSLPVDALIGAADVDALRGSLFLGSSQLMERQLLARVPSQFSCMEIFYG